MDPKKFYGVTYTTKGLSDLPEEILIMIIKQLDAATLRNLYDTCTWIRNIVCVNAIKHFDMSMNSIASVNTFKLNFFRDVSTNLVEFNMCGVHDLCKTALLPVLKRLKSLKVLDVSYTNISILDLVTLPEICPTVKDISINFMFGKPGFVKLTTTDLQQCQTLFRQFDNVHFVGSVTNLLYSKLALYLFKNTKLQRLKYSLSEFNNVHTVDPNFSDSVYEGFPQLTQFCVYLLNWVKPHGQHVALRDCPVLSIIDLKKYEFIIIAIGSFDLTAYGIFVTPYIYEYFKKHYNHLKVCCTTEFENFELGNIAVMLWNKEQCNFDDLFFHKWADYIKQYFPYCLNAKSETVPKEYDWFYITPGDTDNRNNVNTFDSHKRQRVAPGNLVLNYDNIFKDRQTLQLSIVFSTILTKTVAISAHSNYLRKLTYLNLQIQSESGIIRFSSEFFNVLFRCCVNLVTLNVQSNSSQCVRSISRNLPLSHSLKNVRLVERGIDFQTLFSSFSQCPSLENIYVIDKSDIEAVFYDPGILEKCVNLYSIRIEAAMSENTKLKRHQNFNLSKKRSGKNNVNIVLLSKQENGRYDYSPFIDVFRISPIKPFEV